MQSTKAVLTGNFGVGKTSLFNRFVYQTFSDSYKMTIGVRVEKKIISFEKQEATVFLWDIEGEAHQERVPTAYFLGASIILYVFDLTRPSTYQNLSSNFAYLQQLVPKTIIKFIGNKSDLVSESDIEQIQQGLPYSLDLITSAKSGKNVETLFQNIGDSILSVS